MCQRFQNSLMFVARNGLSKFSGTWMPKNYPVPMANAL
jgi:hypothetical protein